MLHFEIEPRRGYLYVTVTGELSIADAEKALLELLQELLSWLGV